MRTDDKAAADRLNSAWDSALAGRPDALQVLESTLADRVRAVQAMAAPSPDREFVASLDASIRARSRQMPWQRTGQPRIPAVDRTWAFRVHPMRQAAAATAVLLTFVVGFVGVMTNDAPNEPQVVQLQALSVATPANLGFTVMEPPSGSGPEEPIKFSECEVPPLSIAVAEEGSGRVWSASKETTIVVNTDDDENVREPPVIVGLPSGPDASAAQMAAINATLRELSACRVSGRVESGPDKRLLALFTDLFRSTVTRSPSGEIALPWLPNPMKPASVQATRRLPDGRVLAVLTSELSYAPGNFDVLVIVFAANGDRWLVDELRDIEYWGPAGAEWEQERGTAELILTDQDPGYRPLNGSPALYEDWTYSLVLYNPENTERGFRSKGLGIDVTVPPYETRTVEFSPTAGEYSFETRTGHVVDEAAPPPCEGMPYPDNIMVVYAEPPLNDKWSCGQG